MNNVLYTSFFTLLFLSCQNSQKSESFEKNNIDEENIITDTLVIDEDTTSLLQITYKKNVNGKTVKTEIDTTKFKGY